MKTKFIAIMSCLFLFCFSCENETILEDFFKDLAEEPDKVIENISGTLEYHKEMKMWGIMYHIQGTIDAVDIYLIGENPDKDFKFEKGKQVTLCGDCYKLPHDIVNYYVTEKGMSEYPAGTNFYYIKVADFYCNKQSSVEDPNDEQWGKGTGQIEFLGKNYPLVKAFSYKWTSFSPSPLTVQFSDAVMNGNKIAIAFSKDLYDTWPSIELPDGIYENFYAELILSDGTQGYNCENNETIMVVNKTDNEYDISITGKVLIYLDEVKTQTQYFSMTWKGEIEVSFNEIYSPR